MPEGGPDFRSLSLGTLMGPRRGPGQVVHQPLSWLRSYDLCSGGTEISQFVDCLPCATSPSGSKQGCSESGRHRLSSHSLSLAELGCKPRFLGPNSLHSWSQWGSHVQAPGACPPLSCTNLLESLDVLCGEVVYCPP